MNTLIVIGSVVFIGLIIVANQLLKKDKKEHTYEYYKVKKFLDHGEHDLYHTLVALFHDQYLIFAKPRVEDILSVKKGLSRSQYTTLRNYIKPRHTDFLLCDRKTSEPLIAIELDGSSHKNPKTKKRDERMNAIYASAGMRYVHIPIQNKDNMEYIKSKIAPTTILVDGDTL